MVGAGKDVDEELAAAIALADKSAAASLEANKPADDSNGSSSTPGKSGADQSQTARNQARLLAYEKRDRLDRAARAFGRGARAALVMSRNDLDRLWAVLHDHRTPPHAPTRAPQAVARAADAIAYADFLKACEKLPALSATVTARDFARMPRDAYGRVSMRLIVRYAEAKGG